jgi:hypothetical protein
MIKQLREADANVCHAFAHLNSAYEGLAGEPIDTALVLRELIFVLRHLHQSRVITLKVLRKFDPAYQGPEPFDATDAMVGLAELLGDNQGGAAGG